MMIRSLRLSRFVVSWIIPFAVVPLVQAGIQKFDLVLPPTEEYVHYNDGYIRGPGVIDLSGLTFTAISEAFAEDDTMFDDLAATDDDELEEPPNLVRQLDGGVENDGTAVDIAIFPLPHNCANTKKGCDWAALGVGKRSDDGTLRWCCSPEALDLGICKKEDETLGRLMIDTNIFKGNHRFVTVPQEGPMTKKMRFGSIEVEESATYIVLYANCNERGREIKITGESVWKSKHGYLPGELFGFMYFYSLVTIVYFLLFFWFGSLMHINEDHRIEIEKWILFAITLGLLEMVFRTGDYYVWNTDGIRSSFIIWIGILAGVLKQGISRCLIVMVSMGWGVVRDSLGTTMRTIVVLGTAYIAASATADLTIVFAIESVNKLSYHEEQGIFDFVEIITFVKAAIDACFIMWVLDALSNTMVYLENMNQVRKLERFLKLRLIFLISVLFAVMWAVFSLVDTYNDEGIVQEEHAWAVDASSEVNYLFVLISVAYLWRPNESAKQYAYVVELPTMDTENENELELTGTIPSAMDDDEDGEGPTRNGGFHDEPKEINRFEIS